MEFETEEQQAEAVKKWFREYGLTIALGLVLGLGGVYGYRYYDQYAEQGLASESAAYDLIIKAQADNSDEDKFIADADAYRTQYGSNAYSNLLGLKLAKIAVDNKDLEKAETELNRVVNEAAHKVIAHTARLRLVRVLIAQEKYEQGLTAIAASTDDAYQYSYELLRGDIWMARGDSAKAKAAYDKAKSLATDSPQHPDLDMLLSELASVEKTSTAEPGAGNE